MNEEILIGLLLAGLLGISILIFIGAVKAQKGVSFWAPKLFMGGATLILLAMVLMILVAGSGYLADPDSGYFFGLLMFSYLAVLLGILLYVIGFFGFCARWGATGKRRAELLEITAALSAARDQAQQNLNPNDPAR